MEQLVPSEHESRALARALIDEWHNDPGDWQYRQGRTGRTGLMVFGLAAHAHTVGAAVLDLLDAGKTWAAVPLTRLALECGVTAMWLAAFDDAIFVLDREAASQEQKLRGTTLGLRMDDTPAELERTAAVLESLSELKSDRGKLIKTRCEDLAGGDFVYAGYRALSTFTHANDRVADLYTMPGGPPRPGNDGGWRASTRPRRENPGGCAILTSALTMARLGWFAMLENAEVPELLRTTAELLGIPVRPALSDQGRARRERGERWWAERRDP